MVIEKQQELIDGKRRVTRTIEWQELVIGNRKERRTNEFKHAYLPFQWMALMIKDKTVFYFMHQAPVFKNYSMHQFRICIVI